MECLRSQDDIVKTQPKKALKTLSSLHPKRETIVLLNTKMMRQFKVYCDEEVGVPLKYGSTLQNSTEDEDCDSCDDVIDNGIRRGLNHLQNHFKKKSYNQKYSRSSGAKTMGQMRQKESEYSS